MRRILWVAAAVVMELCLAVNGTAIAVLLVTGHTAAALRLVAGVAATIFALRYARRRLRRWPGQQR